MRTHICKSREDLSFVAVKCSRCERVFDAVIGKWTPIKCIECCQNSIAVECSSCGKTFGVVDPSKHRHAVMPAAPICTNCLFRKNTDK